MQMSVFDPSGLDNDDDDSQNMFYGNEDENSCASSINDTSGFERKTPANLHDIFEEKPNTALKCDRVKESVCENGENTKKQPLVHSITNMLSSEKEEKTNESLNENTEKNVESIRNIALHES